MKFSLMKPTSLSVESMFAAAGGATLAAIAIMAGQAIAGSPVLDPAGTFIESIEGLDVNGVLYDVTFEFDTYNNLFGTFDGSGDNPAFLEDRDGAAAAAEAISSMVHSSLSGTKASGFIDTTGEVRRGYISIPFAAVESVTSQVSVVGFDGFAETSVEYSGFENSTWQTIPTFYAIFKRSASQAIAP